jgi:hypothetical protein
MYIKLTNNTPKSYTIGQLRQDHPQVSFPEKPSEELLAQYEVYPVKELSKPDYDSQTHYVKQSDFYQVSGQWQVHWVTEQLPQAAQNVREDRNRRLAESDWTQLPDAQVDKAAWASYRQALRDVPAQPGFPFDVVWPVKP